MMGNYENSGDLMGSIQGMKIVKLAHSSHSKDEDFGVKNRVLGIGFEYDGEDGFLNTFVNSQFLSKIDDSTLLLPVKTTIVEIDD